MGSLAERPPPDGWKPPAPGMLRRREAALQLGRGLPGGAAEGGGPVHAAASRLAACCNVWWRRQHPVRARSWGKPAPGEWIVLWGRTEKCLKETTEEIRQMGTECHYFICDVGNREEVYQTAKAVREKVGDITILVNNAAVVHGRSLMDSDDDALLKSQHINTLGQFWTTKAFLPRMLELQNGHIVCLNSVLALSAIPGAIDYCTSKASAFAFMESLTLGLLDCPGVSATTVLPFHTSTEMFQGMRVRFPNLFPPLKPETVARRTVEAVQLNQALLLLPWTMHALVILKSILPQAALEEIHKFSGTYTCMNTFKGRT
uniref:Short-chain dehydrogenase/reductase 3 n=1 Tax=Equus caballus TaxID=9796 RepID=A0A3Q2KPD7_HORSE